MVVVTLDSDFHTELVLSGAQKPSVIRIRIEGLRGEDIAALVAEAIHTCEEDLESGALISITSSGIRVRHIPITG